MEPLVAIFVCTSAEHQIPGRKLLSEDARKFVPNSKI